MKLYQISGKPTVLNQPSKIQQQLKLRMKLNLMKKATRGIINTQQTGNIPNSQSQTLNKILSIKLQYCHWLSPLTIIGMVCLIRHGGTLKDYEFISCSLELLPSRSILVLTRFLPKSLLCLCPHHVYITIKLSIRVRDLPLNNS